MTKGKAAKVFIEGLKLSCNRRNVETSDEKVEFKWLDAKLVGSDTVVFRLEDGAMVKIKVDIDRAGIAINLTNPDGSPRYNINASLKVNVVPSGKKFSIPKSQLVRPPPKETTMKPI